MKKYLDKIVDVLGRNDEFLFSGITTAVMPDGTIEVELPTSFVYVPKNKLRLHETKKPLASNS